MNDMLSRLTGRADELRRAFDGPFAQVRRGDNAPTENFLAIGLGAERCAVRLSDVAGLFADRKITRVPGRTAALLGVAGFRGVILPVYDLPALLGHASLVTPRWLMIAAAAPIALAFAHFEGLLQVERESIAQQEARIEPPAFINEVLRTPDLLRPIIHLPAALDAIRRRIPEAVPKQEL